MGPSGSGKSALALTLIGLGAVLIADDRTIVRRAGDVLMASCPAALNGLIEARGFGILRADASASVPLTLAVDLGRHETQRLPPGHKIVLAGLALDLALGLEGAHFPFVLLQHLRKGRHA